MPALAPYFAKTGFDRLKPQLTPPVREAATKLLELLDEQGQAGVADIHQTLFPLAQPASANAMLNRLLADFNRQAESASYPLRLAITAAKRGGAAKRSVWFEGPAEVPAQTTPDLNGIPKGRLIDQRALPLNPPCVVLLTCNEHEHQAVLAAFLGSAAPRTDTRNGITYNLLGQHGGMDIVHVISEAGSSGLGAAQQRVSQAIRAWRPQAVIAVGIAFGMDETKQRIGNVLVSTRLCSYELSRVNNDDSLTPRAASPDASHRWLTRLKTLDANASQCHAPDWPKLEFGPLLSGEKLVDNRDYRDSLKKCYGPEAIGGEMEGAGLYTAAQAEKVDWLVVKAISDWGDGGKGQDKTQRQTLAAGNAARVVKAAIDAGDLYADAIPVDEGWDRAQRAPSVYPHRAFRQDLEQAQEQEEPPSAHQMGLDDLDKLPEHLLEKNPQATPADLRKDRRENLEPDSERSVDAMGYLLEWAKSPALPARFAILGEYGMGKTITCQRLAQELELRRRQDPSWPVPLYFDLRYVTGLSQRVPNQQEVIEECIQRGWRRDDSGQAYHFEAIVRLIDQGALLILDGLDEVLVKLNEADGQIFTNQLLRLLDDSQTRCRAAVALPRTDKALAPGSGSGQTSQPFPRLLLSCRTHYFRTLREQKTHFTGQERGEYGPDTYLALLLLPFNEEQVRRYLANALPETDPNRLLDTLRAVHNLEELSRRPYTLKLVAEFIPELEQARAAGLVVHGVSLYRGMAWRWLERDKGKHHLKPEHKMRLAAHLAAELWRGGKRLFQVHELEAWFHQWLEDQPDLRLRYARLHPDQLEEDLRTATFLSRQDGATPNQCGFRFAHSSLQEFFLADYLLAAVRDNIPERWSMTRPSRETLDFFGQMLAEADAPALLNTLHAWCTPYRQQTSELLLDYALRAQSQGWPMPSLYGLDMRGADLHQWEKNRDFSPFIPLSLRGREPKTSASGDNSAQVITQPPRLHGTETGLALGPACFAGTDLRKVQFHGVELCGADFTGAKLEGAEFHHCELHRASFSGADLTATIFRRCRLKQAVWDNAEAKRAQFLLCQDAPQALPQALHAPAQRPPQSVRLVWPDGYPNVIRTCVYAPDSRSLLSGTQDGTFRLWDASSGACLQVLAGHKMEARTCAYAPDGRRLLSAGSDGMLRLWDAASGACLRILAGHQGWVNACAYAPDGLSLLSAGSDGTLRLWDATSGECLRLLAGHNSTVFACAYAPDGRTLLSGGENGSLRLWDAASGECLRVLTGRQAQVYACSIAPDGRTLLSVGGDGTLLLWDAVSGECLRVLANHRSGVWAGAVAPDWSTFLSAGIDGTLRLWDAASGECLRAFACHQGSIYACAYAPDGRTFLSAGQDGILRLWDAATGECLRIHAHRGKEAGHFVWMPGENGRVVEASGQAWRWLAWQDAQGERWPLETFGPIPGLA